MEADPHGFLLCEWEEGVEFVDPRRREVHSLGIDGKVVVGWVG
jgi:hypothetical protein